MDRKKPQNKRKSITFEDDDFIFSEEPLNKKEQKILGVKSEYMVFYIAIAIVGVIVAFVLSLASMNFFRGSSPSYANNNNVTPPVNDGDTTLINLVNPDENPDTLYLLGMITAVDLTNQAVQIHDVMNRTTATYFVQSGTDMRGRFNQALAFSEFSAGDLVDINFTEEDKQLTRIALSTNDAIWEGRYTGLDVNVQSNTIVVDGQMFTFNSNTVVTNEGLPMPIADLHPLSMVTMRGVGNTVWYIENIQGFGTLQVIGSDAIMGGFLEVGREGTITLGADVSPLDQEINISEGIHRVVIHGDNVATQTKEVTIINGEITVLDLSDVDITRGHLIINSSTPDVIITLNGMPVTAGEPNALPFGSHRVVAQKTGYTPFDENVDFTEHNQNITILLTPLPTPDENYNNSGLENSQVVTGRQEIRTIPTGAYVFVDNILMGTSPITLQLELGQRNVTLQLDGFNSTSGMIMVSNNNLPVEFELQPTPSLPQPGIGGGQNNNSNINNNLPIIDPPSNNPSTIVPPSTTPLVPDNSNNNPPSGVIMPVTPDDISNVQ